MPVHLSALCVPVGDASGPQIGLVHLKGRNAGEHSPSFQSSAAASRRCQSPSKSGPIKGDRLLASDHGYQRITRFSLGQVVVAANASARLKTEEVLTALRRHASGDWGDRCPDDTLANDTVLREGGRLLSAYGQGEQRFWIITEADYSVTTILLSEDN